MAAAPESRTPISAPAPQAPAERRPLSLPLLGSCGCGQGCGCGCQSGGACQCGGNCG
ncbi:hypothetical protein [Streptomyces sp. B6B3]|uniref:hypothetical protein n=1 Tax=Streptomyces sp. B6B3 TaxID=3153570 RepID=UPI00325DA33B